MNESEVAREACLRLIEAAGRISQDLGLGRIVGQILVYLYLSPKEASLDMIGDDLGLSKASVSIAARQLESLGLLRRVWKKGDRRSYYRTSDNIATAIQQGLMTLLRQKVLMFGTELEYAQELLENGQSGEQEKNEQFTFYKTRIDRARKLQQRFEKIIENPFVKILTRAEKK